MTDLGHTVGDARKKRDEPVGESTYTVKLTDAERGALRGGLCKPSFACHPVAVAAVEQIVADRLRDAELLAGTLRLTLAEVRAANAELAAEVARWRRSCEHGSHSGAIGAPTHRTCLMCGHEWEADQ